MMKRRFFGYAVGAALFLLFLFSSADARQGAADGLRLWGTLLVPSLLPYFAAAGLLTRLGAVDALARRLAPAAAQLFGVSGAGAAVFLLGLSGGYPLGAASIGALYRDGLLQKDEAEHLLAFCDHSGPAFAVGALGVGVFGSAGRRAAAKLRSNRRGGRRTLARRSAARSPPQGRQYCRSAHM